MAPTSASVSPGSSEPSRPAGGGSTTTWSSTPSSTADRAAHRLRLSADHTVVALAGATGSGKSSTFNALTGLELSAVGVRRPTTSWATACVWGSEGAPELLEFLGIPARHQVSRDNLLSVGREDDVLQGVVLLDLPDHDSTEVSHHLEVDRLVSLADMLIWVLDPQKYADAAVHERYLRPLAGHQDVMLVVLNQIDRVPEERREAMVGDVRRLLAADGLTGVPVLAVSSKEGWGVDELRDEIARKVAGKKVTKQRLEADVRGAATRLRAVTGETQVPTLPRERLDALEDAFAEAAGVPTVVKAVEESTRVRANRATGWPVTSWLSKFRPDPLKRLHLDLGAAGKELAGVPRTSVPEPTQVQRARIDTEVRTLVDEVSRRTPARLEPRGPPGLGGAAARAGGPARQGARRHRPRSAEAAGLGRCGPGAAVGADPGRADRRRLAGRARAGQLRPGARAADSRRGAGSRCPRCCCSAGSGWASCSRCCAGCWSPPPRVVGPGWPTSACGTPSARSPTSWW